MLGAGQRQGLRIDDVQRLDPPAGGLLPRLQVPQLYQQIEPSRYPLLIGQPGPPRSPDIPANEPFPRQITLSNPLQYPPLCIRLAILGNAVAAPCMCLQVGRLVQRPQGGSEAHRAAVPVRQMKDQGEGRNQFTVFGEVGFEGRVQIAKPRAVTGASGQRSR